MYLNLLNLQFLILCGGLLLRDLLHVLSYIYSRQLLHFLLPALPQQIDTILLGESHKDGNDSGDSSGDDSDFADMEDGEEGDEGKRRKNASQQRYINFLAHQSASVNETICGT